MKQQKFAGHGLSLMADVAGDAGAPVVLFMHGGGQTRHSWGRAVRKAAERGYHAISIDLRGHGESDWSPERNYAFEDYAADARAVIAGLGRPVTIVGASLGGLTGLLVAGEPDTASPVDGLVLVDVTPRIEPQGVSQIGAFMLSAPDGFASLEEAADAVSAYLPHRPRPKSVEGLRKNLRLGEDGRYRWHWDPDMRNGNRSLDVNHSQQRLEEAARRLAIPTLLVRGGLSQVVSQQSVDEFLALAPHAEFVNVGGADHMVAGDRNDAFNDAVFTFLERNVRPA
ncbi:MAG: alpha/beta hydrolase [Sphingomonadales bacterium]|nr:alpha/beta hydrolase [Sphingomonadales bacterium]MBU3991961.1 alpha/beta hydrolase [Alphaproteobacteria bacterium]